MSQLTAALSAGTLDPFYTASEAARRLCWPTSKILAELKRRGIEPTRAGQSKNSPMLLSSADLVKLSESNNNK